MLSYGKIQLSDLEEILVIHANYLNYGDGATDNLVSIINETDTVGYKCVCENEIIGFCIIENSLTFTGGRHDFETEIRGDTNGKPVWTGAAIAVKPSARGKGIADVLLKLCFEELITRGVHYVALDMWVYPDGTTPSLKFLKYAKSYKYYGEIKNFYRNMDKQKIFCPVCGEHCVCSIKLYVLEI